MRRASGRGSRPCWRPTTEVAAASEVTVTATVTKGPQQYRLALEVVTPSGKTSKTTGGAQCEVLADATALIAAIAIDPSAVLEATEPEEEPKEPEPEPKEAENPEAENPEAENPVEEGSPENGDDRPTPDEGPRVEPKLPPRVTLVRFAFRASGGLDVATLPGVSGGIGVLGGVLGANWRAELAGRVLFPRTGFVIADEAGARLGLFAIGARGCWVPTVGPVEMPLCGGGEAGAFRGDPVGDRVGNGASVTEPYVAAIGSYEVGWAPRPFFRVGRTGGARGAAAAPVVRDRRHARPSDPCRERATVPGDRSPIPVKAHGFAYSEQSVGVSGSRLTAQIGPPSHSWET